MPYILAWASKITGIPKETIKADTMVENRSFIVGLCKELTAKTRILMLRCILFFTFLMPLYAESLYDRLEFNPNERAGVGCDDILKENKVVTILDQACSTGGILNKL